MIWIGATPLLLQDWASHDNEEESTEEEEGMTIGQAMLDAADALRRESQRLQEEVDRQVRREIYLVCKYFVDNLGM